jgi:hypothetical protein
VVEGADDLVVSLQRVERGCAVHLLRYAYDEEADRVPELPELALEIRLSERFRTASPASPDGRLGAEFTENRLVVRGLGVYGIVLLER